jgi:activator of HSP90 ATPase
VALIIKSMARVPALNRRQVITAGALGVCSLAARATMESASADDSSLRAAQSIHQEPAFKADRRRVYETLTDAKQFEQVVLLSAAMQEPGLRDKHLPAEIGRRPGDEFALFGGYISGRQIELVPDELIVQAWRVGNWQRGVYSIARFELQAQGSETRIVFDHSGFPSGEGANLAHGWHANYWQPLDKFLSRA